MFLSFIIGLFIGALLINLGIEQDNKTNYKLKDIINDLQDNLDSKNNLINEYQEENEILLQDLRVLKTSIIDLENNIELLKNNLSEQNKELILDFNN